jgi:hypothetical protein
MYIIKIKKIKGFLNIAQLYSSDHIEFKNIKKKKRKENTMS